jgi:hypothetical protein
MNLEQRRRSGSSIPARGGHAGSRGGRVAHREPFLGVERRGGGTKGGHQCWRVELRGAGCSGRSYAARRTRAALRSLRTCPRLRKRAEPAAGPMPRHIRPLRLREGRGPPAPGPRPPRPPAPGHLRGPRRAPSRSATRGLAAPVRVRTELPRRSSSCTALRAPPCTPPPVAARARPAGTRRALHAARIHAGLKPRRGREAGRKPPDKGAAGGTRRTPERGKTERKEK